MDGVLFINKPKNMTSFDVCAKIRKKFNERSVGHTGTLDPNAEGLLIVLLGKSCKCLPYCEHSKKEYVATIKLGIKTDTGDIWGETCLSMPVPPITKDEFTTVLHSFLGEQKQLPPIVSAIKVDGKKLYEYHREGKTVEIKPRDIRIDEIECLELGDEIKIRAVVSSGTYIRVLCEDIAVRLGTVGTMASLTRTKIGAVTIEEATSIDECSIESICEIDKVINPDIPKLEITCITEVMQGKKIQLDCESDVVILTHENKIVAAYEKAEDIYRCKRGLW